METTTQETPKQEAPKQQAQAPAARKDIVLSDSGAIVPRTASEMLTTAGFYLKSRILPQRFDTPEMIVAAMQYAIELGLKPLTALRQIAVVQGTPCTFGDLPLALVQRSGTLESIREFLVDKDGKEIGTKNGNLTAEVYAAVCIVKRKGDPNELERFFSLDDAKRAGLGGSPTWKSYPKLMLKYRARSQALKDKFADALNGVAIAEYDFHELPDEESPKLGDAAGDLNKVFAPTVEG